MTEQQQPKHDAPMVAGSAGPDDQRAPRRHRLLGRVVVVDAGCVVGRAVAKDDGIVRWLEKRERRRQQHARR